MSASTPPSIPTAHILGGAREQVIPREGDRDLAFKGWRLSQVKDCQKTGGGAYIVDRCTEVSIYLTEGKTIVTHVRRWNERAGKPEDMEHLVGVHSPNDRDDEGMLLDFPGAAESAVQWLKKDNGGRLGALSKRAWTDACSLCPELKDQEAERVD